MEFALALAASETATVVGIVAVGLRRLRVAIRILHLQVGELALGMRVRSAGGGADHSQPDAETALTFRRRGAKS